MGEFKVTIGFYTQPVIIMNRASNQQVAFLKRAVLANRGDDIFYQKRLVADPIFVGISNDFVQVDFGSDIETASEYVDWLNSVYEQTVRELGVLD